MHLIDLNDLTSYSLVPPSRQQKRAPLFRQQAPKRRHWEAATLWKHKCATP